MKKLLIALGAIGAMALTASPAAAQRYGRSHSSLSITVGSGYGSPYGYGYGYPSSYGYSPYSSYPAYYPSSSYDPYYGRSYDGYYGYDRQVNYNQRRHRHHRKDYRD